MQKIKFDFDLIEKGYTVVTRSGYKVTQLTKFDCEEQQPLVGVVDGAVQQFSIDGTWNPGHETSKDLFMFAPVQESYANISLVDGDGVCAFLHETLNNAMIERGKSARTIKITSIDNVIQSVELVNE